MRQRAKALIDIAHPNHREALERAAFDRFLLLNLNEPSMMMGIIVLNPEVWVSPYILEYFIECYDGQYADTYTPSVRYFR